MNVKLWWAKRTAKRIEKYENYEYKIQHLIVENTKTLLQQLGDLSPEDRVKFAKDMGYTEEKEEPRYVSVKDKGDKKDGNNTAKSIRKRQSVGRSNSNGKKR